MKLNYEKIYLDLCEYCTVAPIKERIRMRDPDDYRMNMDEVEIYTESHHIIPRHDGGEDDPSNFVILLPEEHIFAHMVRYKAYNQRGDFLAVRISLNGFMNPQERHSHLIGEFSELSRLSFLKRYSLFRSMIQGFRKTHGWQTEDGRRRISEARSGTFPCVDAITREPVGSHSSDHPNIVSGKWVHHSKGMVAAIRLSDGERVHISSNEYQAGKGDLYKAAVGVVDGSNNPNYKDMTPERKRRLFSLIPESIEDGAYLKAKTFEGLLKAEFSKDFKKISMVWVTNNFGSISGMLEEYNRENGTDYIFSSYYRFKSQLDNMSDVESKKCWVTDGVVNMRLQLSELDSFILENPNFRRGRNK